MSATVHNTGPNPLTITDLGRHGTNPSDFGLGTNCTGAPIAPGESCTIRARFNPTATGPRSATVRLRDTATGTPHTIHLDGTGT